MRGKKEKRFYVSKAFWTLFILILMTLSTIGFLWEGSDATQSQVTYNGYTFYPSQQGWFTRYQGQQIFFTYLPGDLEDIPFTATIGLSDRIYLLYDPTDTQVNSPYLFSRIGEVLRLRGIRGIPACTVEENCPDIPIMNCEEADTTALFLTSGNSTQVIQEGNCIKIEIADNYDLDRMIERLTYQLYGIM